MNPMRNLFGFDIDGLEVAPFLGSLRLLFGTAALVIVLAIVRMREATRISRAVLWLALAGHAIAWFATTYPLPNLYAANGSMDRENHLGWANVVALGFSPLYTFQVNHIHFEPVWPLITAVLAGFEVDRVALVMHWASLFAGLGLILSVRFAWARLAPGEEGQGIEAAFAALCAVLLLAAPGDFWGPFRNPWALTLLLKPNHTLGLILVPLAAVALARAENWKSRLFAGFVLQLVGWAFVIHMALLVLGFATFVGLSWITKRAERSKDFIDVAVAVGANLAIVSPYLIMLLVGYPIVHERGFLTGSTDRPLEATFRLGLFFALSAFGAWSTYRRGGRLGRILSAQWLTAQIIWQAYPLLGLFGLAREQDEVLYWCRFWTGMFAGAGMLRAASLTLQRLKRGDANLHPRAGLVAALSLVLLLPSLLPAWWDPEAMDRYFQTARRPIPDWIAEPTRFIKTSTPKDAVFLGDRKYARWIAAYGARRVLFSNSLNTPTSAQRRMDVEGAILHGTSRPLLIEGMEKYELRYILMTGTPMEQAPAVTIDDLLRRPDLQVVYDRTFAEDRVVILEIVAGEGSPKAGGP